MITSCKGNVVMSSKVRGKFKSSSLFLVKDIMDDFKSLFVRVDVVQSKNGSNLLSPIMISSGERVSSQSILDPFCHMMSILSVDIES